MSSFVPFDYLIYFTVQGPYAWAEAAVGVVNLAAFIVLYLRHGAQRPSDLGTTSLPWVVAHRVLGTCVILYLTHTFRRRQQPRLGRRIPTGVATAKARCADMLPPDEALEAVGGPKAFAAAPTAPAGQATSSASSGREHGAAAAGMRARKSPSTGSGGGVAAAVAADEGSLPGTNNTGAVAASNNSPNLGNAGGPGGGQGPSGMLGSFTAAAAATAAVTAPAPAPAQAGGGAAAHHPPPPLRTSPLQPLPPYIPFTRRHTLYMKVDGAEPEQLGPGWEERVGALLATRGVKLAGAYVRRGCIELLMDLQAYGGAGPDGGAEGPPCKGAPVGLSRGGAVTGSSEWDAGSEDPALWAAIREALALMPNTAAHPHQVADEPTAAAMYGHGGSCGRACMLPRVVSLQPRVLLLLRPDEVPPAGAAVQLQLEVELPQAEEGAAAATAAATRPPLEVLLRVQGRYLAAQVQLCTASPGASRGATATSSGDCGSAGADSSGGQRALHFSAELPLGGLREVEPGLLQVDLRQGGRPCCALPVLLLPAAEESVAEELREATASGSAGQPNVSDDFLYDLGTYLYGGVDDSGAAASLAAHLLAYSEACGLHHSAGWIRAQLLASAGGPAGRVGCRGGQEAVAADAAVCSKGSVSKGQRACGGGDGVDALAAVRTTASSNAGSAGGSQWRAALSELLACFRLARGQPEEAVAYWSYVDTWNAAQAHTIQAVELLALMAAYYRCFHDSSLLVASLWALRFAASIVTALTWPLLPYATWRRLALAVRLPRYACSLAAKVVLVALRVPPPARMASYRNGLGMVAMEGGLVAATCVLSPGAALLVSALRLPLNAIQLCDGTCAAYPYMTTRSLFLAARVEVVALATNLACHVYLRVCCMPRWRQHGAGGPATHAAAMAAGADAGKGGGAGAKGGKAE